MTNEEIINTLEYCITNGGCYNCPNPCNDKEITECAYNLIKRQQAEIERLKGAVQEWVDGKCLSQNPHKL